MADNRMFRCVRSPHPVPKEMCFTCSLYGGTHGNRDKWTNCTGASIAPPKSLASAYREIRAKERR